MSQKHLLILQSLQHLGRVATARSIAEKANLHIKIVAQALGVLRKEYVARCKRKREAEWELVCDISKLSVATSSPKVE